MFCRCAKFCSDECGWSFAEKRCRKGLKTESHELNEGDCPSTSTTQTIAATSAIAKARTGDDGNSDSTLLIVLVAVLLLCCCGGVILFFVLRKRRDSEKTSMPTTFDNPVYERSQEAVYAVPDATC